MSKPLKPKRGTTAENDAYIGEAYEVTLDTEKHTLRVHDGVTPGGFPLARADEVGLPLGFEYVRLTGQNAPLGGVDYMGQMATRAMYADLLAWQRTNKPESFVTEARWQELYASQNGNVPFYSEGDGSTTFRFPRVVGYFKGAGAVSKLGEYVKEGLPNITASYINNGLGDQAGYTGAFYSNETRSRSYAAHNATTVNVPLLAFDASRSNSIYGASDHVTPETVAVVMGVIAIGSVASIGEATEEGIVAELSELGATKAEASELAKYLPQEGGTVDWLGLPVGRLFSETADNLLGMVLAGASGSEKGALLALRHATATGNPGGIDILTRNEDGSFGAQLRLYKAGTATWHGKNIVRSVNGVAADAAGNVQFISKGYTAPVFWHKFSDGLLIQWGQMTGNVTSVTFPVPYTNFYSLVGGAYYGKTNDTAHTYVQYLSGIVGFNTKTNTGFSRTGDANSLAVVRWFLAIGY